MLSLGIIPRASDPWVGNARSAVPFGENNSQNKNNQVVTTTKPTQELNKTEEKQNKWTTRKTIDALTTLGYIGIVGFAIYANKNKSNIVKKIEKLMDSKKAKSIANEELTTEAKILKGEYDKGTKTYRLFDYFAKLKDNSAELTNNLVYGFGTLVVMPIVILFSPIGKKDASKEDRFFTVLRQPISFATVFTMQLTFDKFFKSLMKDLNFHGLLDGAKDKNGKEIFFSKERIKKVLFDKLKDQGSSKIVNGHKQRVFNFDENALTSIKNKLNELKKIPLAELKTEQKELKSVYQKTLDCLEVHLNGSKREYIDELEETTPFEIPSKGNKFTPQEYAGKLTSIVTQFDESKPNKNQLSVINDLVSNYSKHVPELPDLLENAAKSGYRTKMLKQTSGIVANSIASQALGIMMLNFLYGKIMKSYTKHKQQQKNESLTAAKKVEGGQK